MAIIGYAPGAYDMFHIGHLNILRQASQECDHLVAGVVTDSVVLRAKGKKPVIPFEERLEIVRNIRCVAEAVPDRYLDKFRMWKQLRYDVLFKGDDWRGTSRAQELESKLSAVGARVRYFPYTMHTSSTLLRRRLSLAAAPVLGEVEPGPA
ncbi:glycerol-3-phosphate cytidylyltransferase [Saccharopolyspora erythraea NRRL 2338]|uniref:Probable glycerol-3-phosphate cytidyltransferase n=1 Tax=Saccharopolyspora erythraea (strain ATCC 11635 / DSM 40517 / JCM 4748 / NBRC 13426 / NCIMB 8594 / NRRL 2338) TaxID=405948 RepID=A4FEI4_SACEN|nr:glycerol-3-phosphate cytidylyltransferase [Saccharopolyspora erythraea NRRL 2338]CAM02459.1 probable glycerol-3-phosphate cytidyltransferase [Saccharopolyspora erythraea NRRL 2338]